MNLIKNLKSNKYHIIKDPKFSFDFFCNCNFGKGCKLLFDFCEDKEELIISEHHAYKSKDICQNCLRLYKKEPGGVK
ncbi:MAG: hypothetical protein PHE15_01690 [Dehalococcoidales bacterium]|nr:hypothetical protein [Dehalococcoidales bacterium]